MKPDATSAKRTECILFSILAVYNGTIRAMWCMQAPAASNTLRAIRLCKPSTSAMYFTNSIQYSEEETTLPKKKEPEVKQQQRGRAFREDD